MVPATGLAQENSAKARPLVEWHFTGTRNLEANKELKAFREVLNQPETAQLRDAGLDGFARHVAARFTHTNPSNADAAVIALIRPLLPDLLESESVFELSAKGADSADWALAIRLPSNRVELWNTNLWKLTRSARLNSPGFATIGENHGWMTEGKEGYHLAVSQNKDWLLIEGGFSPINDHEKIFADFRKKLKKRPGKEALTAMIDFPQFGQIFSAHRLEHAPKMDLTVLPKKGSLRTEATLDYPRDLGIEPKKWNPPIKEILDPLIGFTAIQGIQKELQRSKLLPGLGLEKLPDQLFIWNRASSPFAIWMGADVGNPATVVSNMYNTVVPMANEKLAKSGNGKIVMLTNRTSIHWQGLPIVIPFIEPGTREKSLLVAGLFPMSEENPQPAPKELFEQLNQKNLVYYDWEITGARMSQYRPIWQLSYMLRNKVPNSTAISEKWIAATLPKLQNTVTQATLEGDSRLKVVRQSQTGFNALELVLLAHLLDPSDVQSMSDMAPAASGQNSAPTRPVPPRNGSRGPSRSNAPGSPRK
jgi:hypothetical protein